MLYQPGDDQQTWKSTLIPKVREWTKSLLLMLLIVLIINLFFPRYAVQGHSMEPQLHEADRLLASNLDAMTHSIERGEVVVLSSPVDGTVVVKRVIGLPGETVEVKGGVVYIDDQALVEEYIDEAPTYSGRWTLGADQYFVLGDNRNHSYDSADYGAVTANLIHGVVKFRWWPLDAISRFYIPEYASLR